MAVRIETVFALAMALLALSGCSKKVAVQCSDEYAQAPVMSIVKEQVEKTVAAQLRGAENGRVASLSEIRAAIAQLGISIADIRTSKEDPNSTKRFCVGTLKVKFPARMIEEADRARELASLAAVSDLADDNDLTRNADTFEAEIEFNVQPTDDGEKVFAETDSSSNILEFATEVVASSLLRSTIESAQRQTQAAEDMQAAALTAAEQQSRVATLQMATAENRLATQTINAVWKAIPSDTRSQLLPLQRAWIAKKDADCRIQAASVSIEPSEIEAARLGCDTRLTQERSSELERYRVYDQPAAEPDPEPSAPTSDF